MPPFLKIWFGRLGRTPALLLRAAPDSARRRGMWAGWSRQGSWHARIFHKLALIAVLSNLPVFLFGYLFVTHSFKEIEFAKKERHGIAYLREIWPQYEAVLVGSGQAGDNSPNAYDVLLGTRDQHGRFATATGEGGDAAISAGQDLISAIANNSGLSVDPDLSTLNGVAIDTTMIPEAAAAAWSLAHLNGTDGGQYWVAAVSRFQHAVDSLSAGLLGADALNADAELGQRLSAAEMNMDQAQRRFADETEALVGLRTDQAVHDRLVASHQQYQAALSGFWRAATESIDLLLERRIDNMRGRLLNELASAAGLLLLVSALVLLLSRSVTSRLASLRRVMERLSRGDLDVHVPKSGSHDEVGAMGDAVQVFKSELIAKRAADETLRQQNEDLRKSKAELQVQNLRFDAALNNMAHGFCMFDRDWRLVISNRRYADIYDLPAADLKPGLTLEGVLAMRINRGNLPIGGAAAYVQRRLALVTNGKADVDTVELEDGRVLLVLHQPMPDGGWVSTHQDITEQRRHEAKIRHLARHDALTDLPNRVAFNEYMAAAEAHISRGDNMAVLWVDLDHFKNVNDTLGHGVGDIVLKMVGARLVDCCRETDVVARFGGDEFAILQGPLRHAEDAAMLAGRIVEAMGAPFDIEDHSVVIGASIGIAVSPVDARDGETLMKNADLALYRAKSEGRGAFHFYEHGMDEALQKRRAVEIGLRVALARDELRLVFQPLLNVKENRICAVEALLRWDRPGQGTIGPAEFVPIAEETGLIVPIGEWVLRRACLAAARWPDHISVAVNLSPVQFRNRHLVQQVRSALDAAHLQARRLELEITETVLLAESESAIKTLHELRDLGVRISMDDFGTGYSSLSYLRSFPFDKIKIDQTFVRDSPTNADSLTIVKAVIGLGRNLGMATTVEGVETEAQLDLAREQGCTEVQGFFLSPPLPESALAELLGSAGDLGRSSGAERGAV